MSPARTLNKIMLVEDEPDIQAIARLSLESVGGFQLLVCGSGEEALSKIASYLPDMILLDVMMPGMDGLETLGHIRDMPDQQDTPVVFMTAKAQPQEVRQYMDIGAADVITKPFDPMLLPTTINGIWQKQQDL